MTRHPAHAVDMSQNVTGAGTSRFARSASHLFATMRALIARLRWQLGLRRPRAEVCDARRRMAEQQRQLREGGGRYGEMLATLPGLERESMLEAREVERPTITSPILDFEAPTGAAATSVAGATDAYRCDFGGVGGSLDVEHFTHDPDRWRWGDRS